MEHLVLDIQSESDAALIKELLKKFENIEIRSFSDTLSAQEVRDRINQGLKDSEEGRTIPLEDVKEETARKIRDFRR